MTTEKEIENKILDFMSSMGAFVWKNQSVGIFDQARGVYRRSNNKYHIKGVPDILGIYRGRFLAIEVKSEKGIVSDDQKDFLRRFNNHNGIGFVARSHVDVVYQLHKAMPSDINLGLIYKAYRVEILKRLIVNKETKKRFAKQFDKLVADKNLKDPNAAREFLKSLDIKNVSMEMLGDIRSQVDEMTDLDIQKLIAQLGLVR